jgi:hypothetical protein
MMTHAREARRDDDAMMLIHGVDEMHLQDLQERQIVACRDFYHDNPAYGMHIETPRARTTVRVAKPAAVRTYMVNGKRPWEK